ncbi:MAG: hypothetical protein ACYSU7_01930 [Planctomycetota bacterium]|jgi:hypothetical protein
MDFSSPGLLMSGLVISMVGLAIFVHGKRMEKAKSLAIGLVMMVFPIFVPSVLWMWLLAGACVAGLYLLPQSG